MTAERTSSPPDAGDPGQVPPGWLGTTPYGAPWPFDPGILDEPRPVTVPLTVFAPAGARSAPGARSALDAWPAPDARSGAGTRSAGPAPGLAEAPLVAAVPPLEPLVEQPVARSPRAASPVPVPLGPAVRRVSRLLPLRGAVALVLAIAAVALLFAAWRGLVQPPAADAHVLRFPSEIAGYARMQQRSGEVLTPAEPFVSSARNALYQRGSQVGRAGGLLRGAISIDMGKVSRVSRATVIDQVYENFRRQADRVSAGQAGVSQRQSFPAGPLGGRVACWSVTAPSGTDPGRSAAGAACLWADNDTFGFFLAPGLRSTSLATTLLTFRSAIEMRSH